MAFRPPSQFLLLLTLLTASAGADLVGQKTPYKREVDGLIRFFRDSARPDKSLADGTCRQTAMVLTAMGHCHRLYALSDGPVVRMPMSFLFRSRKSDGSFADRNDPNPVVTTRWVLAAMRSLAPEVYSAELEVGDAWLREQGSSPLDFGQKPPTEAAAAEQAAALARGPITSDGKPDMAANVAALLVLTRAQDAARNAATAPKTTWSPSQQRGFDFLMANQDQGKFYMMVPIGKDGKFMKHHDLGLTGMGIASMLTKPAKLRTEPERKAIDAGLEWIASSQGERGEFGRESINYTTSAAVLALSKSGDPKYQDQLKRAQRFLRALQNAEERGYARSDRDYGSIGYGGDERGDLSNTQFAIHALRETGLDANDESFAKAIVFLQRTQNLKKSYQGKTRDEKSGAPVRVISGDDGGSAYYPGNSPAGYIDLPDGSKIPRSYGSMTYALLKTYTLCGVDKDDPRIQAAVGWIEKNFELDVNPGADPRLGEKAKYQGLYYYYMVMAQALSVSGIDKLMAQIDDVDAVPAKIRAAQPKGPWRMPVDWREALAAKLAASQSKDGSWLNGENGRWWEESRLVCTTYAMLALEHCK